MLTLKTIRAQMPVIFSLGVACRGSIREQEVREVLDEDVGSRSGEHVRAVYHLLFVDADRDNVARRDGFEVDLIVGGHTTSAFWTPR
jgi:hypothetical protein